MRLNGAASSIVSSLIVGLLGAAFSAYVTLQVQASKMDALETRISTLEVQRTADREKLLDELVGINTRLSRIEGRLGSGQIVGGG